MFELSKSFLDKIKGAIVPELRPAPVGPDISYSCSSCTGTCKQSCSGTCKGSCKGGCTRSCKGNSR